MVRVYLGNAHLEPWNKVHNSDNTFQHPLRTEKRSLLSFSAMLVAFISFKIQ